MKHNKLSDVKERAQVRRNRTMLGLSGRELDEAVGGPAGCTSHFENNPRPISDRERVVYGRLMEALTKLANEHRDYGYLIEGWLEETGQTVNALAKLVGVHRDRLHALRFGNIRTKPKSDTSSKLDRFFDEWENQKPMTVEQAERLAEAEERWKMIETDASARVLIDFEEAA